MTTASLFTCDDPESWKKRLERYNEVMKNKSKDKKKQELYSLDLWYQTDLPKDIASRSPRHITRDEIIKLMKWKLMRGKFRPRLTELIQQNSEKDVKQISENAFKNERSNEAAIKELSKLKAVGPATASAIMCAVNPENYPFMADEAMESIPGFKREYTIGAFTRMQKQISDKANSLNKIKGSSVKWTAHKVEMALWTDVTARKLGIDLQPLFENIVDKAEANRSKRKACDSDEEYEGRRKRGKKSCQ